jgi:hypothetical membrane protein
VAWWGVLSAAIAPALLIGGWTVAAALQPSSFDAMTRTVSSLAALGATDRWVMTAVLAAVGGCDVITGLALRSAATAGRLILVAGGAAGILVAASPEPEGGGSLAHAFWATFGLLAMTAWPLAARRRGDDVPLALRPAVSAWASGVQLALLLWFAAELVAGGGQLGLAERVLGAVQASWPLAVVVTVALAPVPGQQVKVPLDR